MKNLYLENFISELQGRYGILEHDISNAQWICKNTKLNGINYNLEDHEFQEAIINDTSQHVVVKKCSQVGLTEVAVRVALAFLIRNQGTTVIFTQPTRQMALNFSTTRVNDIIVESPLIKNLQDPAVDAKELKKLGKSFLYIKGTKGASTAISVPADFIMTDEYDFSDLAVVGKYNSRLSHSKYKLIWRFSTPTIPDFAISSEFNKSTQNQRLQKCPHCNHWNKHDFFKDVIIKNSKLNVETVTLDDLLEIRPDDIQLLCQKCRRSLTYHDYTAQEWVATHPNRYISGYQVRPWHTASQRMFDIIRAREDYELYSDWVNFALGEDYIDANQIFSLEKIEVVDINLGIPMFIGIDFGKECYIVTGIVDNNDLLITSYDLISEHNIKAYVKDLIKNYFVIGMVLDALPQTKLASDIRDLLPGSAYTAYYSDNQKDFYTIKANEQDVTIGRTILFDRILSIASLKIRDTKYLKKYKEQMQGMVKQRLKDDIVESERFVKVQADHFLHATGYMYTAASIFNASSAHMALPTIETATMQ